MTQNDLQTLMSRGLKEMGFLERDPRRTKLPRNPADILPDNSPRVFAWRSAVSLSDLYFFVLPDGAVQYGTSLESSMPINSNMEAAIRMRGRGAAA